MQTSITVIILISGLVNMIADILLVSGKDFQNKHQTKEQQIEQTPAKHILLSSLIGLIAISFWITPIYFLSKIPTPAGTVAFISFSMYIVSLAVFHVMVSYSSLCYKQNKALLPSLSSYMKGYGLVSVLLSGLYSGSMIYLSLKGTLIFWPIHYLTLPLFSMVIIQFLLGRLLKRVPHFSSVAGTLSMIVSFLSTLHIMAINPL